MNMDLRVNGVRYTADVSEGELLLDVLRRLGFSSVREGCGVGACGACTVLVNNKSVSSCLVLASRFENSDIRTCEGLSDDDPIVDAFLESGAVQCGYCIPGFVLMTSELLHENPKPKRDDILHHLEGNLCRCGTYPEIIDAVFKVVEQARI